MKRRPGRDSSKTAKKGHKAEQGLAPAGRDVIRAKLPKKGTLPHRYRAPARPRARDSSSAPAGARELVVVWRGIEALIPYARNARMHSDEQIAQIAGSIREFGFTNPVFFVPALVFQPIHPQFWGYLCLDFEDTYADTYARYCARGC